MIPDCIGIGSISKLPNLDICAFEHISSQAATIANVMVEYLFNRSLFSQLS